jgi:hypothetical protein
MGVSAVCEAGTLLSATAAGHARDEISACSIAMEQAQKKLKLVAKKACMEVSVPVRVTKLETGIQSPYVWGGFEAIAEAKAEFDCDPIEPICDKGGCRDW